MLENITIREIVINIDWECTYKLINKQTSGGDDDNNNNSSRYPLPLRGNTMRWQSVSFYNNANTAATTATKTKTIKSN